MQAYEEIAEFIATRIPGEVATFKLSQEARERVRDLLQREKTTGLSSQEKAELDHYEHAEHLMSLAKARARQLVSGAPS
jgi:ATP phosphoribosyltransferase regulatory subunit HisZ